MLNEHPIKRGSDMDKPILFRDEMIQAILAGRKTQTRRAIKPQPFAGTTNVTFNPSAFEPDYGYYFAPHGGKAKCPYGKPGDLLWIREAFQEITISQVGAEEKETDFVYRATPVNFEGPWQPSIFMPREASRLTMKITNVRVERVQDISDTDVLAEGIKPLQGGAKTAFRMLWDTINVKGGNGWNRNPWVWVVEFETIQENIDKYIAGVAFAGTSLVR